MRYVQVLLLLFFTLPLFADQLIIEPDMGRRPVLDLIQETEHSLKLVIYGITDDTLLNALIQKKQQGKTVQILLEPTPYKTVNQNKKAIAALNQQDVALRGKFKNLRFIHQKTLITDDKKALIMTFNFTRSAFKNDRNFGLIVDDPKLVNDIAALFSADWNGVPFHPRSPQLIISPDNSREKLISLIKQAKSDIQIYAQSGSDYKIIGALAQAARQGVKVEILTSSKWREKQSQYLSKAGVIIKRSDKRYIHAKVFIFDRKKAVIGSINLTPTSLDQNRELSIITDDPKVIDQLHTTFTADWQAARNTSSFQPSMPDKKTIHKTLRHLERYLNKL